MPTAICCRCATRRRRRKPRLHVPPSYPSGLWWRVGCAKCKQQQLWRPSVISYGVNEMTTTDNSIVGDSRVARLGGNSNFPEVPMLQRHPAVVVAVIGLLPFFLAACSDATSSNDPRMQAPLVRIATVEASPQSERLLTGIVAAC